MALVAIVISILAYTNQRSANSVQISADKAAATAALRHDAEQVTYLPVAVSDSKTPDVTIENRSGGPITNLILSLPAPVQCGGNCGGWKGFVWFRLPDMLPCTVAVSASLSELVSPKLTPTRLAESALTFTDENGNTWTRFGGEGKLITQPRPKEPVDYTYAPFNGSKPANGCS